MDVGEGHCKPQHRRPRVFHSLLPDRASHHAAKPGMDNTACPACLAPRSPLAGILPGGSRHLALLGGPGQGASPTRLASLEPRNAPTDPWEQPGQPHPPGAGSALSRGRGETPAPLGRVSPQASGSSVAVRSMITTPILQLPFS